MIGVQRHEGVDPAGQFDLLLRDAAGGDDIDADRYRRAAAPLLARIDRHDVAQQDRRDELHALDRDRGDRPLRQPMRDDAPGYVHLAQHPAAENMTIGVDVRQARHHAQHHFAPVAPCLNHPAAPRPSACPSSVRHARSRSTGRRAPSARSPA